MYKIKSYDQCDGLDTDETVPSWWKNTHVKLIGWLFIIHSSNLFENKKGIIKLPVYNSVIDINFSVVSWCCGHQWRNKKDWKDTEQYPHHNTKANKQ